jgi:hypothetical protein
MFRDLGTSFASSRAQRVVSDDQGGHDMDRRTFSVEAARLLLGGAAITIGGCGGGSSPAASTPPLSDVQGSVSSNHGHSAVITGAQLGAGNDLQLNIQGTSSHAHTLSLTASEVRSVRDGARVQKDCTGGSHTHSVTFNG